MSFCMSTAIFSATIFDHTLCVVVLNARVMKTTKGEIFNFKVITNRVRVESGG